MAAQRIMGGGNFLGMWSLSSSAGNWAFATLLNENRQIIKTDIKGHPKKKNLVLTPQSDFGGEELETIYQQYLTESSTTSAEVYEDNSPRSENSGNHEKLIGAISLSGKTTNGKRELIVSIYQLDGGDHAFEANKAVEKAVVLTAVRADFPVTVPSACLPSTLISDLSTITLPKDSYGMITFRTAV